MDDTRTKGPSAPDRPARGLPEAALLLACGLLLALNVPVFASRLASVSRHYPLCITEGAEGPTIYPVWKVQAGRPLYEATFEAPYAITWYNFLFYYFYSTILNLLGAHGEKILLVARLITLALAALGAVGHRLVIRRVAGRGGPLFEFAASALVAVSWFGTNYTAWWALSIRPDVGARPW